MAASPLPQHLWAKAIAGLAAFLAALALLIFVPAGTVQYPEAWAYLAVTSLVCLAVTIYLLVRDPALLARRLRAGPAAERLVAQVLIQAAANLCWCAIYVVAGLERRLHPGAIPLPVALAAEAVVVGGYAIVFRVFRENSHTSAVIEVAEDQRVIDTGPYAVVRHPMYAGALVMLAATPVALGSLWALVPVVLIAGVIAARIVNEEQYLAGNLPGYAEYLRKVRYRLVPHLW